MPARSAIKFITNGLPLTQGSNPWLDGVTYNAWWEPKGSDKQESGLNLETPKINIHFVSGTSKAFTEVTDWKLYGKTSVADLPQVQAQYGADPFTWDPDKKPGDWTKRLKGVYLEAYKTWQDVSNIKAVEIDDPMKADVLFFMANFNDDGLTEAGGFVLGSHGSLMDRETGMAAQLPLISTYSNYKGQSYITNADTRPGSEFFDTIIHEIGHGIGLSHPHDPGLGDVPSGIFPGLTPGDTYGILGTGLYGLNQKEYTVMSYNVNNGGTDLTPTYVITPMALDVMAAQIKYGVNRTHNKKNNKYNLVEMSKNSKAWKCIWDTGGTDTITARTASSESPVIINLRAAEMNAVRPETGEPTARWGWDEEWSDWSKALNFIINITSCPIGSLMGSEIIKGYTIDEALKTIAEDKKDRRSLQNKILTPLQNALEALDDNGYDFAHWSQAVTLPIRSQSRFNNMETEFNILNQSLSAIIENNSKEEEVNPTKELQDQYNVTKNTLAFIKRINKTLAYTSQLPEYAEGQEMMTKLQANILKRSAEGVAGYLSHIDSGDEMGGYTIAAGATIENAIGGKGDDIITGNAADNTLKGGPGKDQLIGYMGSDTLKGGNGRDTLIAGDVQWGDSNGSNTLNGGRGTDTAIFSKEISAYSLIQEDGKLTIKDKEDSGSFQSTIESIEILKFAGKEEESHDTYTLNKKTGTYAQNAYTYNENTGTYTHELLELVFQAPTESQLA